MPRPRIQATLLSGVEEQAEPPRDRSSRTREPGAHGDLDLVRDRLFQIAALAEAGRLAKARASCADLLFDFQPLIAARPDLLERTLALLGRCEATALRQRLLIAVHGDSPGASRGSRDPNSGSETMRGKSPYQADRRPDSRLEIQPV
jgi:hypothetical protein